MRRRLVPGALLTAAAALLLSAAPASAGEPVLEPASYPDMTTFTCRTNAITIHPGQNVNQFSLTKTCPNAERVSGPGDASIFAAGSDAEGYVTRFKPSMVEIKPGGELVTPSVWDLHLHHVVWIARGYGPTFAAGEEKTISTLPRGYGLKVGATDDWGLNQMIHNLTAAGGRQVYITWEIDWVPETPAPRTDIKPIRIHWLDVAGAPRIYPVFDAERSFDRDGDGEFVFPDDVPTDPSQPGYEERSKISGAGQWTVGAGGATLVSGGGHLHPGGTHVDMEVARDGPDPGSVDGDSRSEVRRLFRSDARYYEPAGAVSWDVSMEATRRSWRIALQPGDTVSIDVTYDVEKASWYESMGILPVAWTEADDPKARDPFTQRKAVRHMYRAGGILTHGRLAENIDKPANDDLGLPDPRKLRRSRLLPGAGLTIGSFRYSQGGYSATSGFLTDLMRPPTIQSGDTVTFTNLDAQQSMPQSEQVWHSITSCKAPCNRGAGIGYPLASGKFDSGQLGFGTGPSAGVTTGSNVYTTPPLRTRPKSAKHGKTITYFCRIHPFMRGSIRVK